MSREKWEEFVSRSERCLEGSLPDDENYGNWQVIEWAWKYIEMLETENNRLREAVEWVCSQRLPFYDLNELYRRAFGEATTSKEDR